MDEAALERFAEEHDRMQTEEAKEETQAALDAFFCRGRYVTYHGQENGEFNPGLVEYI